jgi:DNA-binding transcriptional MerR regulator
VLVNVSQVAELAGVNVQTLRYYERCGLLPDPPRSASGYRQYSPDAVERVRFIKQAQTLGFSLREAQLIQQHLDDPDGLAAALDFARHKVAELDAQLERLQSMRRQLADLIERCMARTAED